MKGINNELRCELFKELNDAIEWELVRELTRVLLNGLADELEWELHNELEAIT